jgi:ketosteroid isomerase-like protein/predicted ester cyclase
MKNVSIFVLTLFCLCGMIQIAAAQDNTARDKANIQKAYDALNRRDWATFESLCTPNFTDQNVGPAPVVGIKAAVDLYKQFQAGFPDFNIKINEIASAGNGRYLLRVTITGTNTGSFMMLPPTGKPMKFNDADLVELNAEGKCFSHTITNGGEPLRQIGYGSILNPSTQTVMAVYEKFGKGDVAGILAMSTDDVWFDIQDRMFDAKARTFKGKAGVGQFFQELGSKFQYTKFQPTRFVADGDDVFALIDAEYKHLPSGKTYASTYTHHFKVVNGKVTFFRGLDDFQMMK